MKIMKQNAGALFFEKMRDLGETHHDSWRCIHFNFAKQYSRMRPALRDNFVVRTVMELLADEEGYIYICEGGDIFILFQGPHKHIAAKLASQFEDLNLESAQSQQTDHLTIFDLSKHWRLLFDLCRAKYLNRFPTAHRSMETVNA